MTNDKRIFAVAGEPSGDVHTAQVIRCLNEQSPGIQVRGFGGEHMAKAGMDLKLDLASNAIMGLFPVIKSLAKIRHWFAQAIKDLSDNPPDALLLVDYPGFNLRLAKKAKQMGIPVIYYISPQVWAWNQKRVEKIRQWVDLMIVILPFEKEFYDSHDVDVYYPGHPLADRLRLNPADPDVVAALRGGSGRPLIGLFPGSRAHVVDSLAPEFVRAAEFVTKQPGLEESYFLIAAADKGLAQRIRRIPDLDNVSHEVVVGQAFEVMEACDLALTTSGTTTIELAGHLTPMVLAYKVSPILLGLGKLFVKVPHIGLVNLICGRGIVHEHIASMNLWRNLGQDLADLALDHNRQAQAKEDLKEVVERLESPGSYQRTAARIIEFIEN